jgi:hypothetical protein
VQHKELKVGESRLCCIYMWHITNNNIRIIVKASFDSRNRPSKCVKVLIK